MKDNFNYSDLICLENLFQAWNEFKKGKRRRKDVQIFERNLEDNLFNLHWKLKNKTYLHGKYQDFYVYDPKKRHIHKAEIADRIIHHLLYKYLYHVFDKSFIYDSYSCRLNKGTHKAIERLKIFSRKVSKNYSRDCWALKCDIKKFFASVDHQVLFKLLKKEVADKNILWLLYKIIKSFHSDCGIGKGIPLGNLTSQVFANIYLNELDQYIKHELRIEYYLRYTDDFLILYPCKNDLNHLTKPIQYFLQEKLKLELHPKKVIIRKLEWGIDFLGYIVLPNYVLPRTKTKRRIFKKLKLKIGLPTFNQSLQSYLGYLSHTNSFKITQKLNEFIQEVG